MDDRGLPYSRDFRVVGILKTANGSHEPFEWAITKTRSQEREALPRLQNVPGVPRLKDIAETPELWDEFRAFLLRAKLNVPDERHAALYEGFIEIRRMAALMHEERPASSEPAQVFRIRPHE